MAIARVQTFKGANTAGGTTIATAASGSAVTAGNTLVAFVRLSTGPTVSITDTVSNTYVPVVSHVASGPCLSVFKCVNCTGGSGVVATASWDGSSVTFRWIMVLEYSGVLQVDTTGSGTHHASAATDLVSSSFSTAYPNEMVVLGASQDNLGTYTAGTNFTLIDGAIGTNYGGVEEYLTTTALSSYTAHITSTVSATYTVGWISLDPGHLSEVPTSNTLWGGTRLGAHVSSEDYGGVRLGAATSSAVFPPAASTPGVITLGHAVAASSDAANITVAIGTTKRFNRAASNYSNTMPADLTNTVQRYNIISLQGFNGPANAPTLIAGGVKAAIYKNGIQMGYGSDSYLGNSLSAVYAVHPSEQPGGAGGSWDAGLTWNNGRMSLIGDSGFQAKWASNTIAAAATGGFNWVFVDDVKWKLNSYPAAYPNETAWRAATLAFIQGIYTPLNAAGLGMVCNIGSVGADSFQGAFPTWLAWMDGYMDEGVGRNSTSHSGSFDSGSWIPNRLANLATCQSMNKLAMWEIPADDSDTALITYGICMLLLGVDSSGNETIGIGGTAESDGSHYGHEVWTSVHTAALALGAPTAAATGSVTTGYFRQFANGAVRLNPTTGTLTINGTSVAATTGLIS